MKVDVIKNEKDSMEFFIRGERHTLANLLKEKILEDKDVDFCAYKLEHPSAQDSKMIVKGKNPKKSIENAIKETVKELDDFKKTFNSAK